MNPSLSIAVGILHLSTAHAHPVDTSLGAEPTSVIRGTFRTRNFQIDLITVPAGQDLIINAATCNGNCLLSIDGNPVVSESMHATDRNYSYIFVAGNANLIVPSGSTLSISTASTDNYTYFGNGRLVQQHHPRRSFFGTAGLFWYHIAHQQQFTGFRGHHFDHIKCNHRCVPRQHQTYDSRSYAAYYGMCNSPCKGNVSIPIAAEQFNSSKVTIIHTSTI